MRPDPRLLVPREVLPFVPAGATLEDHDGNRCVAGEAGGPEDFPGCLLDLSAPALRVGTPERLDALPWALAVLASRGWRRTAAALLMHDADANSWGDVEDARVVDLRVAKRAGVALPTICLSFGDGHDRTTAARAVVAAALRGGR
jgi:hypothetical protein